MDKAAGAGMTSQCDADAAEFSPSKLLGEAVTQTPGKQQSACRNEEVEDVMGHDRTHRSITGPHSSFAAWLSQMWVEHITTKRASRSNLPSADRICPGDSHPLYWQMIGRTLSVHCPICLLVTRVMEN